MFRIALSVLALAGVLTAAQFASAGHRAANASVHFQHAVAATEQSPPAVPASARPVQHPLVPGATDDETVPVGIGWG